MNAMLCICFLFTIIAVHIATAEEEIQTSDTTYDIENAMKITPDCSGEETTTDNTENVSSTEPNNSENTIEILTDCSGEETTTANTENTMETTPDCSGEETATDNTENTMETTPDCSGEETTTDNAENTMETTPDCSGEETTTDNTGNTMETIPGGSGVESTTDNTEITMETTPGDSGETTLANILGISGTVEGPQSSLFVCPDVGIYPDKTDCRVFHICIFKYGLLVSILVHCPRGNLLSPTHIICAKNPVPCPTDRPILL